MKSENKELIIKVVELFEKFQQDVFRQKFYDEDCCLIFSAGKDSYQIQIQIDLKDDGDFKDGFDFKINTSINVKINDGILKAYYDNITIEGIEKLEEILVGITDKESVYN